MAEGPEMVGPLSEADTPGMLEPGLTQPLLPTQQQPPDEKDVSIAGEAYRWVLRGAGQKCGVVTVDPTCLQANPLLLPM